LGGGGKRRTLGEGGGTATRIELLTSERGRAGRRGFVYFIHGTINALNLFIRRHLRQNFADENDNDAWNKKKSSRSHDKDTCTVIPLSGPKGAKLSTICKYLVHMSSLEAREAHVAMIPTIHFFVHNMSCSIMIIAMLSAIRSKSAQCQQVSRGNLLQQPQ
jgi:hypothetical protein